MRIIEIKSLENGGHNNQTINGTLQNIPDDWAVIPDDMETPNFPFGEIEVKKINGVMTVTKWTAGVVPELEPIPESTPEPTTDEVLNALLGVADDE